MGIKEKDLEGLILQLFDTSPEIQNKIRNICGISHRETEISNESACVRNTVDKRNNIDVDISRLNAEIIKYKKEYQTAIEAKLKYESKISEIKEYCKKTENEKKQLEISIKNLENELANVKDELGKAKNALAVLKQENDELIKEKNILSGSLSKADTELCELKNTFSMPVSLLARYKSLSLSIKEGLSDIICDKNEVLFVASCSSSEHLKSIWIYTKRLIANNGEINEIEVLKDIFDYFFEMFNNALSEPVYVRDEVEIGMVFDDDKYDRSSDSSTSGTIKKVLLKGYSSINTRNIICRSLVKV